MGLMDNMQDDMSANRERLAELHRMEQNGELDDEGREELMRLRSRVEDSDM
jgi:hypothetical protein